ncbi:MAG: hypothetical protein QOE45_276 [Frankiaceae bacterium]|jgi:hypothetical protein|nr:hypothetical protein [Frankiaceae bacterium]
MTEQLIVRSNVARDILGTADDFGSVPKMIVEYVSNSLDNPDDPARPVTVNVDVRRYGTSKTVTISDDGSGMDETALEGFFVMHRENAQRQRGRRARGRFGTGKSAGFGVGTSVVIETIRGGRHWLVELTLTELRAAAKEDRPPIPRVRRDGQPTDRPNGTTITVDGIGRSVKPASIMNELRRRLGRQLESHRVYVSGDRVHLVEPAPTQTWTFVSAEDTEGVALLGGSLRCDIHAVAPGDVVDDSIRGVVVTSRDIPVAQYAATGDLASRMFGLCEVPALEDDVSTPGPFTDRRDLTLNPDNALAAAVEGWVRRCLEIATRELHEQERDRLRRARDAELQDAAVRAEDVLNQHYRGDFRMTAGAGSSGATGAPAAGGTGDLSPDPDGDSVTPNPSGVSGYQPETRSDDPPAEAVEGGVSTEREHEDTEAATTPVPRDPLGDARGDAVAEVPRMRRRRSHGGFHIDYSNAGSGAPRAAFYPSELTIVINLDHPLLAAVVRDRDLFQGLAFTIAAEEYAQATANELLEKKQLEDAYEALNYARTTMDKLSRAFAEVFSTLAAGAGKAAG